MIPNQPEYFAVPYKRNTVQATHVILLFLIVLIKNKTAEIILIMYHFYLKYFKKCYARHVYKYQWLSCSHTGQQFEVLSMNKDIFLQHKTTIRIRKLTSTAILLLYYTTTILLLRVESTTLSFALYSKRIQSTLITHCN